MRELWKKTALLAAIGFAAGLLVGLGFLLLNGIGEVYAREGAAWMIVYLLISSGMGMVNMGTMTIYGIERWSITRATLTHFCIVMSTFSGLGAFLGWFHSALGIIMLVACVIMYIIIWLIIYLSYKRQVRRMNEDLKRWKDTQGGE